jgi:hypothetical protein
VYAGDANFQGSASALLTQSVKATTTTSLSASNTAITVGQAVQFTASVIPAAATGTVQFLDGATALGTAALSSGTATLSVSNLAAGSHSITAAYAGDAADSASMSPAATVMVTKATVAILLTSLLNPSLAGQSVTFTAALSPSSATGSMQFLDGTMVLGTVPISGGSAVFSTNGLSAGSHSIEVRYSGDDTYSSASTNIPQTVKATTTTSLSASNTSITVGQAVQLTASVSPGAATGTVQFLDGASVLGSAALSGGIAAISISTLATGSHSITATYSGDGTDAASTSSAVGVTVAKLAVSVSAASSLNPSVSGQGVTLTATVTPAGATGTVQFLDGGSVLGTAVLGGGAATFTTASLAPGSHSITASYSGDATYTSGSAVLGQTVKAITSTVVTSSNANAVFGQSVQFIVTVTPITATGAVQFKDGSTVLATVSLSGGAAVYSTSSLAIGTHSITAVYGGDALDVASSSGVYTQTISPGAPSNLIAATQSSGQINLAWTASPTSGVTYNVYASTTPGFTPSAANLIATGVSHTNYAAKGLAHSTTYYFVVTAQSNNGESMPANEASGATK